MVLSVNVVFLAVVFVFCSFSIFFNIKKMQREKSASRNKCDKKNVLQEKGATTKKCNMKRVQHEKNATRKKCYKKKVQ